MNVIDAKDLLLIIVALVISRIVAKFIVIFIKETKVFDTEAFEKHIMKENEETMDEEEIMADYRQLD